MVGLPQTLRRAVEPHPRVGKILAGCGLVSSVWYIASDIIGTLRYPGYSWLDQEFSELTAQGSPVRPLMVVLNEFPYTVLMPALSVGLWNAAGPKRRAARVAATGLAGYAVIGFAAGTLTPMATREAMAASRDTLRNAFHGPLTMVMDLSLIAGMALASQLFGKRFRYYSYGTIAILLAFGILTALQIPQMQANQPTAWMGLEERVNIYATMLWIGVLAVGLLRAEAVSAPRRPEKPVVAQ